MTKIKHDFCKEFDSWSDALRFAQENDKNCEDGYLLSIPNKSPYVVRCSKIQKIEYTNKFVPNKFSDAPSVISDSLGVHGITSMADGKSYDSKSAYRKELKKQGFVEMGTSAPTQVDKTIRGDFVTKKEIAEAINRHS